VSALEEIWGADFKNLSNSALYRLADLLVAHRGEIEVGLALVWTATVFPRHPESFPAMSANPVP
jgi:hypothetical protein